MPKKKLPQRPDTHTYNEIALNNLRTVFSAEQWAISNLEDIVGGVEYGIDWLLQYRQDDLGMSGIEFRVQSKVTQKTIGGANLVSTSRLLH